MKNQLGEKNSIGQTEENKNEQTTKITGSGFNIDKSALLFGGLYVLTMILILLVIIESFQS